MVWVKICGITNLEDAEFAVECGVDALGFVFYKKSPRFIAPEIAASIISRLPSSLEKVGVFVNEPAEKINTIAEKAGLTIAQLHGDEPPEIIRRMKIPVIKAIRIRSGETLPAMENYSVKAFLLDSFTDSYGGSGRTFDWGIALEAKRYGEIIVSGGLTPANVEEAIKRVKPFGVDVSSGVELAPGKKDKNKVLQFVKRAKADKT